VQTQESLRGVSEEGRDKKGRGGWAMPKGTQWHKGFKRYMQASKNWTSRRTKEKQSNLAHARR